MHIFVKKGIERHKFWYIVVFCVPKKIFNKVIITNVFFAKQFFINVFYSKLFSINIFFIKLFWYLFKTYFYLQGEFYNESEITGFRFFKKHYGSKH